MPRAINALDLLRQDHRRVLTLLRQFEKSDDQREQRELCHEIITELDTHTMLEEDCFYPFVREATDRLDLIEEATIEHTTAKELMRELAQGGQDPVRFIALGKVLGEYVNLHVRDEEERIFPIVQKLGIDLEALGEELAERKRAPAARTSGNGQRRSAGKTNADEAKGSEAERHSDEGRASRGQTREENDEAFLREQGDELSRSAQHAKWIHSVEEHEDHAGQTLATRNADVIRQWAEARDASPATTPGGDTERPRVLRFDFPGYDTGLELISWDAWLGVFKDRDLVFLYQEHKKNGKESNFFRLDSPERDDG